MNLSEEQFEQICKIANIDDIGELCMLLVGLFLFFELEKSNE